MNIPIVLKLSDIMPFRSNYLTSSTQVFENEQGRVEDFGMTVTWKGLNLEKLLGDEYHKHETFSLDMASFTSVSFTSDGAYGSEAFGFSQRETYSNLSVICSGFDFLESYSVKQNCHNQKKYLGGVSANSIYINSSGNMTYIFRNDRLYYVNDGQENLAVKFRKSENINVTINLRNTVDENSSYSVMASAMQHWIIKLNIKCL
jgi:hypothetical protein